MMKKILLNTAILLLTTKMASAQAIKLDPFAVFGGRDLLSGEFALGEKNSLQVGIGAGGYTQGDYKFASVGAHAQYRIYFKDQMNSLYLAPGLGYRSGSNKIKENNTEIEFEREFSAFAINVRIGRQWIWESGFLLDLNAGLGFSFAKYIYDTQADSDHYGNRDSGNGVDIPLSVAIGYAFNTKNKKDDKRKSTRSSSSKSKRKKSKKKKTRSRG